MFSANDMQKLISWILLIGTLLSALLVTIGGGLYLYSYGHQPLQTEWLETNEPIQSVQIIRAGLFLLVSIQTIRVALLCGFYTLIKDYKFTLISAFILIVLIYSSFFRH